MSYIYIKEDLVRKNFLFIIFFLLQITLFAQGQRNIVQLTGLVVEGDSAYGIGGAYVYVPSTGRGTITNEVGYFSLPVLAGDTINIRSFGHIPKVFIVPANTQEKLSAIIQLDFNTQFMSEVTLFPWATEEMFKEAFLSLNLPRQNYDNMNKNLNDQVMRRIMYTQAADGNMNQKYYLSQQIIRQERKNMAVTNPFLNPFAWARFIKDVKSGGLKSKYADD